MFAINLIVTCATGLSLGSFPEPQRNREVRLTASQEKTILKGVVLFRLANIGDSCYAKGSKLLLTLSLYIVCPSKAILFSATAKTLSRITLANRKAYFNGN